jgi:hypothetical protein
MESAINGRIDTVALASLVRVASGFRLQEIDDWYGSNTKNGDGLKASPAVWGRDGFIEG